MNFYADKIQKFFESIAKYFNNSGFSFSWLFIIFMGVFALTTLIIVISSIFSYEFMLTRAIEKINKFLSKNPRINDDNLIAFNNKMKEKSIPKILRRQWQQFMLYREHEASYYMSFQHCVENPLKNSTYRLQMQIYKVVSLILVFLSILLGVFTSFEPNFVELLQDVLIIPVFILVLYFVVSMILNLVHNATTGDLYQNYQYFEINIDKATLTLPEYVDYEVLFTQEEIKHGIPILFEYIQKRAIEEQKELERARIKNVEHEKFNFEKSGLDASLVLERSMQEAENYIATRKKFMQDIEQVNNEMASLENQYKENVKENQRLMQTSKESVDGLKKQLEQATSSIEINYIKKQMKDEINRQQIAERDFDALTDKYNKETKVLQAEVERLQGEIDNAKKNLESNMMSEFGTYSSKIYEKVEEAVQTNEKTVIDDYKKQINDLEEKLALKDEELDNVYTQYQAQLSQLEEKSKQFDTILKEKDDMISQAQDQLEMSKSKKSKKVKQFNDVKDIVEPETSYETVENDLNYNQPVEEFAPVEVNEENIQEEPYADNVNYTTDENIEDNAPVIDYDNRLDDNHLVDEQNTHFDYTNEQPAETVYDYEQPAETFDYTHEQPEQAFNYLDSEATNETAYDYLNDNKEEQSFNYLDNDNQDSDADEGNTIQPETFNYLSNNTESDYNSFNYLPDEHDVDYKKAEEEKQSAKSEIDGLFESWNDEGKEETSKLEEDSKQPTDENLDDLFDSWLAEDDEEEPTEKESDEDEKDETVEEPIEEEENLDEEPVDEDEDEESVDENEEAVAEDEEVIDENYDEDEEDLTDEELEDESKNLTDEEFKNESEDDVKEDTSEVEEKPVRRVGRPRKVVDPEEAEKPKRRVGRPRKVVEEPKRAVGRPRKVEEEPKRKVGRPKKIKTSVEEPVRRVGRPRKEETVVTKRQVGRPKKANPVGRPKSTKSVGRPRKVETETKRVGRPKKEATTSRPVGRPKKARPVGRPKKKNPVGRPKKASKESPRQTQIKEIDKQLQALYKQIARESNNIAKTQKQLANVKLKKTKK